MNTNRTHPCTRGQVLVLAVILMGVFVSFVVGFAGLLTTTARVARAQAAGMQALRIAEGGVDAAVAALNADPSYAGESGTEVGEGTYTATISTIDSTTKKVTVTAYVPDSSHPTATKTVSATLGVNAAAVSFRYGVQAGTGGFRLTGGSTVNGDVYANGSIAGDGGARITGSATAANPAAVSADQVNDQPAPIASCTSSTCITFGNANSTQDVAQSFKVSQAIAINHVELYLKKTGTPSDATVRIVSDSGGSPSGTTLLSSTLPASAVTSSFAWVSVTLPSTPVLDPSKTYWLVVDAGTNSSKYYQLGANADGYAAGTAKRGRYGSSWSALSPAVDGYFRLYLGGGTSYIGGASYSTGLTVGGDAAAHAIIGTSASGTLYCQTSTNTNKACNTSQPDPTPQPMPVSDGAIEEWQEDASSGTLIAGDEHVDWRGATLGPAEIDGDLTVDGGGTLTLTGTLWVRGEVTVTGGGKIRLDPSFGAKNGVLLSDGPIDIGGGASFSGSGTAGSYLFFVTTSACPADDGCGGANAVDLNSGSNSIAVIAQNGTAHITGGSQVRQVTANLISMDSGATLTYDSGLVNADFSSGPGGSWAFVPGTYSIAP
jgi:hypothetical protein